MMPCLRCQGVQHLNMNLKCVPVCCQARKLETELDVRLAAFGKLCASFDTTYGTRGEAGLATDQVHHCAKTTADNVCCCHVATAYWQAPLTPVKCSCS